MSQREREIKEVELSIEEAQESMAKREAMNRLRANKDFNQLIEVGFLQEEASRLVLSKAEPALQEEFQQKQLDNMITAVGYFRQYLNKIYQLGNMAEDAIKRYEQTRDELMAEED